MDRRGNVRRPDFSKWTRPPIDGAYALQIDSAVAQRPQMQLVSTGPAVSFRDNLVAARNEFATKEKKKTKFVKAYEVEQDVVLYQTLAKEKGKDGYEKARRDLDSYMEMQLKTHLGERLNVGVSRLNHTIVGNEIRAADTDEPFLDMLKRGRDYRRIHGKAVDWDREEAEVVGFERIQKVLVDPDTPVGTMMFFVSPKGAVENGSIYKSNFYDVYLKVSENRSVSARYTSGLTPEESQQRLRELDSRYDRGEVPTDAEFIANPIRVDPGTNGLETPDAIHDFMHVDHAHMSNQKFEVVLKACQPLIVEYIQSLQADPDNIAEHGRRLDIMMNYADNVAKELETVPQGKVAALFPETTDVRPWLPPQIDREALSKQEVHVAETGCGSSGSASSAFSVVESAGGKEGGNCSTCQKSNSDNHYHCPGCTRKYADETSRDAEDRTKKCNCGFEFGC